MSTYIYALIDPRTDQVRYIGKSDNPQQRLHGHLADKKHCHRTAWLIGLRAEGRKPTIEIIDCVPNDEWQKWERYYIAQFRRSFHLVNGTDGGENPPDPTGRRVSEKTMRIMHDNNPAKTIEARRKISASKKGMTFSKEHKQKLSEAHKGIGLSTETKARMSAARMGHETSDETREKISIALRRSWAERKAK